MRWMPETDVKNGAQLKKRALSVVLIAVRIPRNAFGLHLPNVVTGFHGLVWLKEISQKKLVGGVIEFVIRVKI